MSTVIDLPRVRVALARLSALAASAKGQDACRAIADELSREDAAMGRAGAAMGRAGAADVRQLVLPLADAANDDAEVTDDVP